MPKDHVISREEMRFAGPYADQYKPCCLPQAEGPALPECGGLLPGTRLETCRGFVDARAVSAGDRVYTYDGGCREVRRRSASVPALTPLMDVPAGALGNDTRLLLPARQRVAVELDAASQLFGVPLVLVRLAALAGHRGITPSAPRMLGRIHLGFDEDELIWAETGLLLHAGAPAQPPAYRALSLLETRKMLAREAGRALAPLAHAPVPAPLAGAAA